MRIKDVNGQDVRACCIFTFRGLEISASTIFYPPSSIVVFDNKNKELYNAISVEDAIAWITKHPEHWKTS